MMILILTMMMMSGRVSPLPLWWCQGRHRGSKLRNFPFAECCLDSRKVPQVVSIVEFDSWCFCCWTFVGEIYRQVYWNTGILESSPFPSSMTPQHHLHHRFFCGTPFLQKQIYSFCFLYQVCNSKSNYLFWRLCFGLYG